MSVSSDETLLFWSLSRARAVLASVLISIDFLSIYAFTYFWNGVLHEGMTLPISLVFGLSFVTLFLFLCCGVKVSFRPISKGFFSILYGRCSGFSQFRKIPKIHGLTRPDIYFQT